MRRSQQQAGVVTPYKVRPNNIIKLRLIGESKLQNLIHDNTKLHRKLSSSPLAGNYIGDGRANKSKHELILELTAETDPKQFLTMEYLDRDELFPVIISIPNAEDEFCYGVIKRDHTITTESISEELQRGEEANMVSFHVRATEPFRIT